MGMFAAMDIAISGATVSRTWMDAISHNIANINTVNPAGEEPFRALVVAAESVRFDEGERGGVRVREIALRGAQPAVAFDPNDPNADPATGLVTRPVVDLGQEMTNLVIASRTYEANLGVVDRMRDAYMAALRIGQR
jgi:flagellar basal-body rod protein FlgC